MEKFAKLLTLLMLAVATVLYPMEPESNHFEPKTKKQKIAEIILVGDNGSGQEFMLPLSAAKRSEMIKNMIDDLALEQKLPLNVESVLLSKVVTCLKHLDSIYHEPNSQEYVAALNELIKPELLCNSVENNIKLSETFNRLEIPALIQLPLLAVKQELHTSKDINAVAVILERIGQNLKDFHENVKSDFQNLNKSLYYQLFLSYIQISVKNNCIVMDNPLFTNLRLIKLSPNIKQGLLQYQNGNFSVCDFNDSKIAILKQFLILDPKKTNNFLGEIALSPNGHYALISMGDHGGYLLDLTSRHVSIIKHFYFFDKECIKSAVFSKDNTILLIEDEGGCIRQYHMNRLEKVDEPLELNGYPLQILLVLPSRNCDEYLRTGGIAITSDNKYIFGGFSIFDRQKISFAEIWDAKTHKIFRRLKTPGHSLVCVAISDDAKVALTGSKQGKVCLWDLTKYTLIEAEDGDDYDDMKMLVEPVCIISQEKADDSIDQLALDNEGKVALTYSSHNRKLTIWNLEQLAKPIAYASVQLPIGAKVHALAFDNQNNPVIPLSYEGNPYWCSFGDFMKMLTLSQLVLLRKLEEFKAHNRLAEIYQCAYFKDIYAKLPQDIKKAADEIFYNGQH